MLVYMHACVRADVCMQAGTRPVCTEHDMHGKARHILRHDCTMQITGFSSKEVVGRDLVQDFITEEYRVSVKEVLDDALQGREAANFEFPLYTKDKRRVEVLLNATTRRDVSGNVVGVLGVGQEDGRGRAGSRGPGIADFHRHCQRSHLRYRCQGKGQRME